MAGIKYDYCEDISPFVSHFTFGTPWGDALGGAAGTICTIVRTGKTHGVWTEGRKQCNGYTTPVLKWLPFKVTTKGLNHLSYSDLWKREGPSENPYYALDVWIGIEERNSGKKCVWFGVDAGPGVNLGPDVALCAQEPHCERGGIRYGDIYTIVEEVLEAIAGAVDKDSAIDLIIKTIGAVLIAAVVIVAAFILAQFSAVALLGTVLGGAIIGSGAG